MKYYLVFLFIILHSFTFAQSAKSLRKAFLFTVYKTDKQQLLGVFSHTTDTSLIILDEFNGFARIEIPVTTIQKIEVRRFNSEKRNTLIGACIGFGIGFAFGWEAYDSHGNSDLQQTGNAIGGGLLGGFIGAFAGHLTSGISTHYSVLGNPSQYQLVRKQLDAYAIH